MEGVLVWWKKTISEEWMGFQLFQKLKQLKKKIYAWKRESFGRVEEKKA